jgi:hypothetical protein
MAKKIHEPIHPGEVLLEDFLKAMGISSTASGRSPRIPPCAWRASSAHRLSFGWGCRTIMI